MVSVSTCLDATEMDATGFLSHVFKSGTEKLRHGCHEYDYVQGLT